MGITKLLHINRDTSAGGSTHLQDALRYIMRPEKTEDGTLIGGGNLLFSTPEIAYENMMQTKRLWKKENGRQAYHFIISLEKGEANPEIMMDIMSRFAEEYLGKDYEYVYTVHTDQPHIHGHLIFNSVNRTNGRKYHYKQGDWQKYIQPVTNRLCAEYGLSTIKFDPEWDFKEGDWKAAMREDIDDCRADAASYEEFLQILRAIGYTVHDGKNHKYLTLIPPGKDDGEFKGHRTNQLGEDYSKEALMMYFDGISGKEKKISVADMTVKSEEKKEKWKSITFTKYEFYMPTKEIRRIFVDHKQQRRELRTAYDRRAFLYKKDVEQLKTTMERQTYLLDHGIKSMDQVRERYHQVRKQYTKVYKEYKAAIAAVADKAELYDIYERYRAYKALEDMYAAGDSDPKLYDFHKEYVEILKEIKGSPYSVRDFEGLEELKKERTRIRLQVRALNSEKKLLAGILKDARIEDKERNLNNGK